MSRQLSIWFSLRSVFALVGLAIAAYVAYRMMDTLVLLFVALLIAAALRPVVEFFERMLKVSRTFATLLSFVLLTLLLGMVGLLIIPPFLDQVKLLGPELGNYVAKARSSYAWVQQLDARFHVLPDLDEVMKKISASAPASVSAGFQWAGRTAGALVSAVVLFFATFYVLVDGKAMARGLLQFVPDSHRPLVKAQIGPITGQLGGYVIGLLTSISFLTVYLAISLSVARVPLALVLAFIAGMLELVPMLGATVGTVLSILMALTVSWKLALVVVGIFAVGNFIQGNIVAPLVFARAVQLPPLGVMLALLAGAELNGLAGAIVAIPVAATLNVLAHNLALRRAAAPDEVDLDAPLLALSDESALKGARLTQRPVLILPAPDPDA